MFDLDGIAYPVVFANYQRNSCVPVTVKTALECSWSKEFAEVDPNAVFRPTAVLSSGGHLGVRCPTKLLLYNGNGGFRFIEPLSQFGPIIFAREAMAFLDPALGIVYQDYTRRRIRTGGTIPYLAKWAYALLLKPEEREVLAAVQFSGGPERKPPIFFACIMTLEDKELRWYLEREESRVDMVLLTNDGRRMVMISEGEVEIIDAREGTPVGKFSTGFESCLNASLDRKGNLLFLGETSGNESRGGVLKAFDLSGKELWAYASFVLNVVQPPACGASGRVYLVNGASLECISEGTLLWSCPLKSAEKSFVTVTKDDFSIVLNGHWLYLINAQGEQELEKLVSIDIEETFDAPPAIGSEGQVFVASGKRLYCFK